MKINSTNATEQGVFKHLNSSRDHRLMQIFKGKDDKEDDLTSFISSISLTHSLRDETERRRAVALRRRALTHIPDQALMMP